MIFTWLIGVVCAATPMESLFAAEDEVLAFPADYGAWTTLARAAESAGAWDQAMGAWQRASELSGGNLETATALVRLQLRDGEAAEAREVAMAAVVAFPESRAAGRLLGVAWSTPQTAWEARGGLAVLQRAQDADPSSQALHCAMAWSAAVRGSPSLAREHLKNASVGCVPAGLRDDDVPMVALSAGVTGLGWSGTTKASGGVSGSLVATAIKDDTAWGGVVVRGLSLSGDSPISQVDVWGRAGAQQGGHGLEGFGGVIATSGYTTAKAVGARGWTQWRELGVSAGVVRSSYGDGTVLQAEGTVSWLLSDHLQLSTGLRRTGLDGFDHTSLDLGVAVQRGPWSASSTLRLGSELRPVRLDGLVPWNTADPLTGSLTVTTSRALGKQALLGVSVDALRTTSDSGDSALLVAPTLLFTLTPRPLSGGSR